MSIAASEACWIVNLLNDFGIQNVCPVKLLCDNQAAIMIANTDCIKRTKHIDIKYHFVKDLIRKGKLTVHYLQSGNQVADLFTKPLNQMLIVRFSKVCGLM